MVYSLFLTHPRRLAHRAHMALMHLRTSLPPARILVRGVVLVRRRRAAVPRYLGVVWQVAHIGSWRGVASHICVLSFYHFFERLGAPDEEEERRAAHEECYRADDDARDGPAGKVRAA